MNQTAELKRQYLEIASTKQVPVSVFLQSGIRLTGKIIHISDDFEHFLLVGEQSNQPTEQLIQTKTVASIVPITEPPERKNKRKKTKWITKHRDKKETE